ncbi:hypothetical protein ACQKMI_15680 [Lysinibacillus sp. NPDC097214]|uniref:hypothetical protein n=1 Tax=Lysinibacillus sp. NPDC097214 TaxID=3390584 RepID=UPI003D00FA1C
MWRMSFLAIILAALFLGGCNWGNRAVETRPAENVKHDVRRGVEKVEERNDVYNRDVNGVNRNTMLPEATTPGTTTVPGTTTTPGTVTPGTVTPGTTTTPGTHTTGEVKEKIVEEKVTR